MSSILALSQRVTPHPCQSQRQYPLPFQPGKDLLFESSQQLVQVLLSHQRQQELHNNKLMHIELYLKPKKG